jgi:hypothetical protein
MFSADVLQRQNYRGRQLPTAVGVLVPVTALFVVGAGRVGLLAAQRAPAWDQLAAATLLTTAGFGDVAPVTATACAISTLESLCGILFPATLIARIASLPAAPRGD